MLTCVIRYKIDPEKIPQFEAYGAQWIRLVPRFDGLHHGYYLPAEGASNIALALFSFPSLAAYERYRSAAAKDPDCQEAYRAASESGCIVSYKRSFFRPLVALPVVPSPDSRIGAS